MTGWKRKGTVALFVVFTALGLVMLFDAGSRAVLGYEPRIDSPDEDLVDPHDRDAAFWFEQMDEPRADGKGAIHVAVFVPIEKA